MKLRSRIMLTILAAALLPLILASIVSVLHSTEQVRTLTIGSAQGLVRASAEQLSGYFAMRKSEMLAFAHSPVVATQDWSQISPFLKAELKRFGGTYEKFVLAMPDGSYYATNAEGNRAHGGRASWNDADPAAPLIRLDRNDFFRQIMDATPDAGAWAVVSDPMISYTNHVRQVCVAAPVMIDGKPAGVLAGAVQWAELERQALKVQQRILGQLCPDARLAIVSGKGAYVFHWESDKCIRLTPATTSCPQDIQAHDQTIAVTRIDQDPTPEINAAAQRILGGQEGYVTHASGPNGQELVTFFCPVESAGYSLMVTLPATAVSAPVTHMRTFLLLTILAAVLLSMGVSWLLVQGIVRPIQQLRKAAAEVARGNWQAELSHFGHDELGELNHSFDHMAEALQSRQHQLTVQNESLAQANTELQRQIGERQRAEQALRIEKDFAENLVQTAHALVCVTDNHGMVLRLNRFGEDLLGYRETDLLGEKHFAFLPPQSAGHSGDDLSHSGEDEVLTRDGKPLLLRWFSSQLRDAKGKAMGILCIAHDVTDIREKERQLRQASKMEAVGQLAGGIAHDFNNILTIILGNAEFLRQEMGDSPQTVHTLDQMIAASRRAADLTQKMLTFARKGKSQAIVLSAHELIEDVVGLIVHSMDKRIVIRQELHAECSSILGDPSQLQNALVNLALNARDAMPEGGELIFATDNLTVEAPPDGHASIPPGRYVRLSVRDTGIGMDAKTQSRIFEPFFTTKEVGKGTGLGLASVYGCVKNHHGSISVRSTPGKGTEFSILLPVDNTQAKPPTPAPATAPAAQPVGRTKACILVVEDEELLRSFVCKALNKLGYETITCRDGRQAVDSYRIMHRRIDMVLLDEIMPAMTGREALRLMCQANPDIRVVMTSGYSGDASAEEILAEPGVRAFLRKPYALEELADTVARTLADNAGEPSPAAD